MKKLADSAACNSQDQKMRRGRTTSKHSNNLHVQMKCMDSEDSDEDYVAEVDELDDQSDELESLVGDASEEDSCFEEWKPVAKPRDRKRFARSRSNGKKRPMKRKKVLCDEDEGTNDDDEEFTPNETGSSEEEEDIALPKRRKMKRGRIVLKRGSSLRSWKRRTGAEIVRKCLRKRSKKTGSLKRQENPDGNFYLTEKGPILRSGGKKKPAHRKKRVMAGSDSDFCTDSSDYEFTISEKEWEKFEEDNDFCRNLTINLRSSRRVQDDVALCLPTEAPVRKGKEKAEEPKYDDGKPVCGICLTEEGKNTNRGTLNCCSHYFCFTCIMEWSKVESRCPLCKQRFVTISKLARCIKGFDPRISVVQIPERDQVYQPSEEELRDFLNPYEHVICTLCHQAGDDDVMLLCNLCDSPAHTYCVGFGQEVPEGNWYCDVCQPSVFGSHSQAHDLSPDQRTGPVASFEASTYENIAEVDLNMTFPETSISQTNGFLSSPGYNAASYQASSPGSGMGASTVYERRRIHRQMQVLLSSGLNETPLGAEFDSLRSILSVGVASTFQQSRTTDVGAFHYPYNVESRLLARIRQVITFTGSDNSQTQWSEMDGMNSGASQIQVSRSEEFFPCTSGSSLGLDIGTSPSHNPDEDRTRIVKQHVHSIVNSQLKSLSQDLDLSYDDSVVISRRATDTIMVAYEREPPRRDTNQVRRPCCLHVERCPSVEISPMNECCFACFEGFAKDIVKRMMITTLGPAYWRHFRA